MPDLEERLSALSRQTPSPVDDATIAADVARGRAAFRSRRRKRAAVGIATAVIVGCAGVSYALTANGGSGSSTNSPAIRLVDYHGRQLAGYTVSSVPEGYVLQGISGATLDVSKAGDHSPLNTFVGKLVVTLDDHVGTTGDPVTVGDHHGRIYKSDDVTILTYEDGDHHVNVQQWTNIDLTQAQLIEFAEGITVEPGAQVSHG